MRRESAKEDAKKTGIQFFFASYFASSRLRGEWDSGCGKMPRWDWGFDWDLGPWSLGPESRLGQTIPLMEYLK
jgi:hypothetical protein